MNEYIVTFGFDQVNPITGKSLANHYVRVPGIDEEDARMKMVARFGNTWAFIYPSEERAGVQKFKLKELELSW